MRILFPLAIIMSTTITWAGDVNNPANDSLLAMSAQHQAVCGITYVARPGDRCGHDHDNGQREHDARLRYVFHRALIECCLALTHSFATTKHSANS